MQAQNSGSVQECSVCLFLPSFLPFLPSFPFLPFLPFLPSFLLLLWSYFFSWCFILFWILEGFGFLEILCLTAILVLAPSMAYWQIAWSSTVPSISFMPCTCASYCGHRWSSTRKLGPSRPLKSSIRAIYWSKENGPFLGNFTSSVPSILGDLPSWLAPVSFFAEYGFSTGVNTWICPSSPWTEARRMNDQIVKKTWCWRVNRQSVRGKSSANCHARRCLLTVQALSPDIDNYNIIQPMLPHVDSRIQSNGGTHNMVSMKWRTKSCQTKMK